MDIGQQLALVTNEIGIQFTLNGNPMTADDVFHNDGLLPAIVRRADQLCSFCLGYGLGISFDEAPDSKLGVNVKFDDVIPSVMRIMCSVEIIYELIESSPDRKVVPLDDLMYD